MLDLRIRAARVRDVRGRWCREVFGPRRAVADGGAVPGVPAHSVVGVFVADDRDGHRSGG